MQHFHDIKALESTEMWQHGAGFPTTSCKMALTNELSLTEPHLLVRRSARRALLGPAWLFSRWIEALSKDDQRIGPLAEEVMTTARR